MEDLGRALISSLSRLLGVCVCVTSEWRRPSSISLIVVVLLLVCAHNASQRAKSHSLIYRPHCIYYTFTDARKGEFKTGHALERLEAIKVLANLVLQIYDHDIWLQETPKSQEVTVCCNALCLRSWITKP